MVTAAAALLIIVPIYFKFRVPDKKTEAPVQGKKERYLCWMQRWLKLRIGSDLPPFFKTTNKGLPNHRQSF
jgi:hypothetical protein